MIYSRSQIGLFQDNFLNCVILWASPNCGTSIGVFKMSILLIIKCIGQVHFFYFLSEVMITLHELNHQNQMVCCRLEYRFLFFFLVPKESCKRNRIIPKRRDDGQLPENREREEEKNPLLLTLLMHLPHVSLKTGRQSSKDKSFLHGAKMPEGEVLYSDLVFVKSRGNGGTGEYWTMITSLVH